MATVTNLLSSATTANSITYDSTTFGPAVNDLLLVFSNGDGTAGPETLTDSRGIGFTLSTQQRYASSANLISLWVANALSLSTANMTVTTSYSADAATGHFFFVAGVSGMTLTGLSAIRQTGGESNAPAATTPAPSFPAAMLTSNAGVGDVGNQNNPAFMTPPNLWTEADDLGHTVPVTGAEWAFINSGSTLTTITWGSVSASAFGDIVAELDTSTGAAGGASVVKPRLLALMGVGV